MVSFSFDTHGRFVPIGMLACVFLDHRFTLFPMFALCTCEEGVSLFLRIMADVNLNCYEEGLNFYVLGSYICISSLFPRSRFLSICKCEH